MIEKVLTPDSEVRQKYAKIGVVAFIKNHDGQVLLLQEKQTKRETGKNNGDISVLCETSEDGESWEKTLVRGVKEELCIDYLFQPLLLGIDRDRSYLGETMFVERVLARVVIVHFLGPDDYFIPGIDLGEVKVVGWESPDKMADYSLRTGVRNVLSECLDSVLEENRSNDLWPLSIAYLHMVDTGGNR